MVGKAQFHSIALSFPGSYEKLSHGERCVFVEKRFLTRLRAEDDGVVLYVGSVDERDMLLEADPETYFITDHYKNYPIVLARLRKLDAATLRHRLQAHWNRIASKTLQKRVQRGELG